MAAGRGQAVAGREPEDVGTAPPVILSRSRPPISVSVPSPPDRLSLPALPLGMFAPVLPVMVLAPSSPVRLPPTTPALVVSCSIPLPAASVKLPLDRTLSVPLAPESWTMSRGGEVGVAVLAAVHDVCAAVAGQHVGAGAALQMVDGVVAGEELASVVAGAVDRPSADQGQVLEEGAQRIAHGRIHQVGAVVGRFGHDVASIVYGIGIVAGPAGLVRHRPRHRACCCSHCRSACWRAWCRCR